MEAAMPKRLQGKTVLITCASSGTGRSTAFEFALTCRQGFKLILTARRIDRLEEIAADIRKGFGSAVKVFPVQLDISNANEVQSFVHKLSAEYKEVDVLVNNAGLVRGVAKAPDIAEQDINIMFMTNVTGLINMTQAIIPMMLRRNGGEGAGDIIIIGSMPGMSHTAGMEYTVRPKLLIRVIGIDPGHVETEFSVVRFYGDKSKANAVDAGCEPLTPDDIAETIVFATGRRENVVIADTLLFPNHQASATIMHRKAV